jgi:hypothetical protein
MADKVGVFNRLQYATSGSTTGTAEFEFLPGSTLGLTEQFVDANQLRGTRSHSSERVRRGNRRVDGVINMCPTPVELVTLLPLIYGGTPSGTSYPLGESLTLFNLFAIRDGTVYTYEDCAVETATFSATEGGPMQLSMTVVGKQETASGTAGATTLLDLTTQPFVLMDAVATVASSSRQIAGFSLTVRNFLEVKYRNSTTPTQIVATDREVTLDLPISFGTDSALYGSALAGVAVSLALTNGNCSLTWSATKVQAPKNPIPIGERNIIDFPWRGVARKDGTTLELTTVLDSTP